jgi:hypothetical protein
MAVDIPNSPSNGQTLIVGARTWRYNSTTTTWEVVGGGAPSINYAEEFLLNGM